MEVYIPRREAIIAVCSARPPDVGKDGIPIAKKAICFILCIAIVLALCGCGSYNNTSVENAENDNRMTLIYADGFCRIYRDNATGVQYFENSNGGTCVMVNADGTPYTGEG